jgi:hypothetical protein
MTLNEPIQKKPIHDGVIFKNKNTCEKFAVIQIIPTNDLEVRHFIRKFVSVDTDFLFSLYLKKYNETRNEKSSKKRYNIIVYNYKRDAIYMDSENSLELEYDSSDYKQIDTI